MDSIKVLVTGALGQLGKTIQELYSENTLNMDFVFASKESLDITNLEHIGVVLGNGKFDYCINCAAYTNVEQAEKTPEIAYAINAQGVKNLSLACKENNIILIHISTDYVFDGEKKEPYIIKDSTNPINEYGKSKLLGEQYIEEILSKYFIIRTSWLYSKKYGNNFYKTIIKKVNLGETLYITDSQTGCPTETVTLSKHIISFVKDGNIKYGIYHFSDEKPMTWYSFAKQILKEKNKLNKIKLVKDNNYITFAHRPKNSILINSLK